MAQTLPRADNSNKMVSSPLMVIGINQDGTNVSAAESAPLANNTPGEGTLAVAPMLFDSNTGWTAERNNLAVQVFPFANRTATTISPTIINYNWRTIIVELVVIAEPAAGESITLLLNSQSGGLGTFLLASAPPIVAVSGQFASAIQAGPGVTATYQVDASRTQIAVSTALAREFVVAVVHSGSGIWNYAVWISLGV